MRSLKSIFFFHISSRVEENRLDNKKIEEILRYLLIKTKNVLITAEDEKLATYISLKTNTLYLKTKSLQELSFYLANAKLLITLDGGVAHLAPALGVKSIVLFGKTDLKKWAPIYGHAQCKIISSKSKIANDIPNEEIYQTIDKMLNSK